MKRPMRYYFYAIVLCATYSISTPAAWAQREEGAKDPGQAAPAEKAQDSKPEQEPANKPSDASPAAQDAVKKPSDNAEPKKESEPTKPRVRSSKEKEKGSGKKQIRILSLGGNYEDLPVPPGLDPASLLTGGGGKAKSFYRLCEYIDELGTEELVTHVVLDLSDGGLSMNSAQLDELTRHINKLKSKGKKIYAWLENADNVHLSVAAPCDEVILTDFGGVDMPSSSMASMFYREAMDLVGVKASVVRAGDFKGAVEPYTNPTMSEHLRKHYLEMLESINAAQVSRIAKGRGLTNAVVRELQKKRLLTPNEALAAGLVSKLAPYGSMKATINTMVGDTEHEWTRPKAKPKREVSFFELMSKAMSPHKDAAKLKEDSIVVLHMSGAIEDGKEESPGAIVSGPTVKWIEELIQDDHVRGVVVRINSPGGSATASEAIRQALNELAKKKPLVFSMGEMAASGGYWITCIGQPIYAEHGTITGSIGVFSLKLSLGALLRRVGVHVESVALDSAAGMNTIDRTWTDEEIANMQKSIDEVYDRFLKIAGESRHIPVEKLQTLAGGRVWSGDQAKQRGLVDEIGGLDDCIAVVAKKAGLEKYKTVFRPDSPTGFDILRMLEEREDELGDIKSAASDSPLVLKQLESQIMNILGQQGFRGHATRTLLKSTLRTNAGMPQIWALMPDEIKLSR